MPCVSPKRNDVLNIPVDDEVMLHDQKQRKVYTLNPVAALVWSLCDGSHTADQIVASVKSQFSGYEPSAISPEIHKTITQFREYGLLDSDGMS
ncbi:MAG: PqqD family protein [Candidatus Electrothrix sp. LOE2]|nr:PqqD family protein [Candidatus Electrothrix sp. LOE2]